MSKKIKLWRSNTIYSSSNHRSLPATIPATAIWTSARQCLTEAVIRLGMSRTDYIGIPDYSSHCVIDFIGRIATPVPLRFLPSDSANAVLIYDQWGWEKSLSARSEIKVAFPKAKIIWDRVDSLPKLYDSAVHKGESEAEVQVFSLKKTLTATGGGLLWIRGEGWIEPTECHDEDLVLALQQIMRQYDDNQILDKKVNKFICDECDLHLDLQKWIRHSNIDNLSTHEHLARIDRMKTIVELMQLSKLPMWMHNQIEGSDMPAPGIWPLVASADHDALIHEVSEKFNLELRSYHFNFNDSYINPIWKKVLGLPLHSEVSTETLEKVCCHIINAVDM